MKMTEREAWLWAHDNGVKVHEYRNGSVAELGEHSAGDLSPHGAIINLRALVDAERNAEPATAPPPAATPTQPKSVSPEAMAWLSEVALDNPAASSRKRWSKGKAFAREILAALRPNTETKEKS